MESLSQLACKAANKVCLGLIYGETAQHAKHARKMIDETLITTCHLLDSIDPVELRSWFEQFESRFAQTSFRLVDDPGIWSRFIGTQCDVLQVASLSQKTIEGVGNELAKWDRQVVTFDQFAMGLDGLSSLVTGHAQVLAHALDWSAGQAGVKQRTSQFANSVCGLAVVLIAINCAIEKGDPRDVDCAAMASFGASLTSSKVKELFGYCQLNSIKK